MKINGTEYKKGAGVVYSVNEDDLPAITKISSIFVINSNVVILKGECFSTQYNPHFRAYLLRPLNVIKYHFCDNLMCYTPLYIRSSRALPYDHVVLPYHIL